ncbi:MAG: asparagine synthase (glutamine-hydrolyzing) [Flavobacteriales bacterium]|nr:asparagine synthase (glutamine-hydrolyzing) [Flavobacteriales bacterium]
MCGIAGAYFIDPKQKNEDLFDRSLELLNHRGPDATASLFSQKLCLGHKRLSIIDLDPRSNQPFTDENEEFALVFNGEVYNYQKLKKDLEGKGHQFKTTSDTEVLFVLLKVEGKEAIKKLEGCFAFAFADLKEQKILLSRDRMGINPLYYSSKVNKICFASELRTIRALHENLDLDQNSIDQYFKYSYIPAPHSAYSDVYKLEPGHLAIIENGEIKTEKYYSIPRQIDRSLNFGSAKSKLSELMDKAVQKRLISDVPLGSFLSGGIDSSIISAIATDHTSGFKTFSIGFEDAQYFDETHYAEEVATKIGSDHKTIKLKTEDLVNSAREMLEHIDEPFADSSAIAVNLLSKEVRKHITVALSGDGADEIFSGYNKHSAEHFLLSRKASAKLINVIPDLAKYFPSSRSSYFGNKLRQFSKLKQGIGIAPEKRYEKWLSQLDIETDKIWLSGIANESRHELQFSKIHDMNDVLFLDSKIILPNDMLYKVDLSSMRNSLEVRTPFLDKDVVEFAFSLPVEYKIDQKRRKIILRETYKGKLPESLFTRKKQGFEIPMKQIILEGLSKEVAELLSENFISDQNLFSNGYIAAILRQLRSSNPGNSANQIWSLLVFQKFWMKNIAN